MPAPLVLVIGGPTASGKSSLALRLARHLGQAELVCADSVTVYRGLDIGSAKPSAAERAEIPHHLLDIASPKENFTAADFVAHARAAIAGILSRGAVPVVVGGTGFYLRALLRGMAKGEENETAAAAEKAKLEARAKAEGWDVLYRELMQKDPGSAPTIHPNDHYRIVRALQAMALHGRPWSELNREARAQAPFYPGLKFFCVDPGKEELEKRILSRAQSMVGEGLLAEVRGLVAAGVPMEARPLQSVGYAECVQCLRGEFPESQLAARIAQGTKRLAKSQRTWFKGEELARWASEPEIFRALGLTPKP